jgi:hypothetical protein
VHLEDANGGYASHIADSAFTVAQFAQAARTKYLLGITPNITKTLSQLLKT